MRRTEGTIVSGPENLASESHASAAGRSQRLGALLAVGSSAAYGFNTPFARLAHENGISPAFSVPCRASLLLIISAVFIIASGGSFSIPQDQRWRVSALGLFTAAISVAYLGSVAFISVSLAAIIFFTFPIQILICSMVFAGEGVNQRRIATFAAAFAGLVLVIGPQSENLDWRGVALAFTASAGATAMFFTAARIGRSCRLAPVVFWVHMIVVPVSLGVAVIFGISSLPAISSLWWPVAIVSVSYVAAYALQIAALRLTSAVHAGLFFNLEPIMTGLVAAIFIGERLLPMQYAGAVLVAVALFYASLSGQKSIRSTS